ncbi:MAG: hypothetical protein ABFD46_07910 [Armatimonadota bacterium]
MTQAHAEAWVKELVPLVENVAGRKFKKVPECKVLTTDELIKLGAEQSLVDNKDWVQRGNESNARRLAEKRAELQFKESIAVYHYSIDKIFIVPNQVDKRMQSAKIAGSDKEKYIRAILAHELAHALCDQYGLLEKSCFNDIKPMVADNASLTYANLRRAIPPIPDEVMATNAAFEGFAQFIEDSVAKRLGLEEVQQRYKNYVMASGPTGADVGAVNTAIYKLIYYSGRDFIAWHYKNRGSAFVWRILANPPATSAMVFHPETYSPTIPASRDYRNALGDVAKHFGNRQWKVEEVELGAMKLRGAALTLPEKDRDVFSHCDYVKDVELTGKDSSVIATLTVFDSSCEAIKYLNRKADTKVNADLIKEPVVSGFSWIKADKTFKREYIEKKGNRKVSHRDFFVASGKVVVWLEFKNVDFPQKVLTAAFNDIFNRLPKEALQSD